MVDEIGGVQTLCGGRQREDADLVRFGRYSFGPRCMGETSVCVCGGDPKDMSRRPCPFGNQPAVENQCPFGAVFGMFHVHNRAISQSVNQEVGPKIANLILTSSWPKRKSDKSKGGSLIDTR